MVVGTDGWGHLRKSLMEVVGFESKKPQNVSNDSLRRSSSLNSLQSLCSTALSSNPDENMELSPEYLKDVNDNPILPEVPEEDEDEDWRMFGWLLDAAEANEPITTNCCKIERKISCPAIIDPLSPISVEISDDEWSSEAQTSHQPSDLLTTSIKASKTSTRPWWKNMRSDSESEPESRKRSTSSGFGSDTETDSDNDLFEERRMTRSMAYYLEIKRSRKTGAPWPTEPALAETPSTVASGPISSDLKDFKIPKMELKHDLGYSMEADEPISEFSTSPLRSSGRQPVRAKRLSPGVESSTSKSLIQSVCPSGVSIISSIDLKEMRKSKPGRPSNKDKKKMERQIAMQRKKLIKSGISQEGAIEFDINACHCICRQPYDAKKFYLACNRCKCWFHGKCVNITEKKAKRLPEWMCAECAPGGYSGMKKKKKTKHEIQCEEDDNVDENQLFCICRKKYDYSRNYIGCDGCNGWFHFECVGVTEEMSKKIKKYTCPLCEEKPSQLSRDEFAAMCAAVDAMAEDEQSLLFSSDVPEGREFRETIRTNLYLNDIFERVQTLHYKNFQEFVNEVANLQSAILETCSPNSILPSAIEHLTNKASTILLEHLPNHPALTG